MPLAAAASPFALTVGSDNKLWFTESPRSDLQPVAADRIGRVTLDGPLAPPPNPSRGPHTLPSTKGPRPPLLSEVRVRGRNPRSARITLSLDTRGLTTSYRVECARNGRRRGFRLRTAPGSTSVSSLSIPLTSLTPGKTYTCRVFARGSGGSAVSGAITLKTPDELDLAVSKVIVVEAGEPFAIRVRSSLAATATVSIIRRSSTARTSRLTRRVRLRSGRNAVHVGGLRAGRLTVTIRAQRGETRQRASSRLIVTPIALPRFTG